MAPERVAVYTTVYPGVERFLTEWFSSVRAQTDRNFDLWVGVDGLSPARLAAWLPPSAGIRWCPGSQGDTPAAIRNRAMTRMVTAYDAVVFVDSDDLLHPSRVEAARQALAACDVTGCSLALVDEQARDLHYRVQPPGGGDAARYLPRLNVFGLSNTAYRSAALQACLPVPSDCVFVDWFLATRAWLKGMTLGFDPEPRMQYRQHAATMARLVGPFTPDEVRWATGLVVEHYRSVLGVPAPAGARWEAVEAAQAQVERFQRAIAGSPAVLARYVEAINRQPAGWAWWWWIAAPELEDVWSD